MIDTPVDNEQPIADSFPAEDAKPRGRRRKPAKADGEAESAIPAPVAEAAVPEASVAPAKKPARNSAAKGKAKADEAPVAAAEPAPVQAIEPEASSEAKPKASGRKAKTPAAAAKPKTKTPATAANSDGDEVDDDGEPRRGGWWQRTFG